MAIFVCGADESADQNPKGNFFYAGFAASIDDWDTFEMAWRERVLDRQPSIPYLHMTDIRSPAWQRAHGLSGLQAGDRLDEAATVIRSMGSLVPIAVSVAEPEFDTTVRQRFQLHPKETLEFVPNYLCFMAFTVVVLDQLHTKRSDVDKVDFLVEQSGSITRYLEAFHKQGVPTLVNMGMPALASLVDKYTVEGKNKVQTQVADMLAWHARNFERNTLDRNGVRRFCRILDGKSDRYYLKMNADLLRDLAAKYVAADASQTAPKV